ncbi:Catabolite control protein A [Posidoniimonas polymericola]|uniref:Catabolite control protein A n=1 Tax=Posidoniimonas polymericola TaxID=2528002 RepID=A0A5C5YUZ5_9BACT|nr:LacI family DNA-binding transcriptional regulator [Posidoniimonas polymericola]TWT78463.1 Catabolite control protein A [Posidoniimonas polymericola]
MPASIEDVAKLAKVSISTVSRVLNRRNVVNPNTRERVEKAIRELGYRPNVFARGLMLRKSNIIGLVLPDLHGEFYSEIIRGANEKTRQLGYHLMVSAAIESDDSHDIVSAVSNQGIVDGLIAMVSETNAGIADAISTIDVPLVVLDGDVQGVRHDCVVINQNEGAAAMMAHLIKIRPGKPIIFVGGNETNLDTIDRLHAYRSAVEQAGGEVSAGDIFHLDYDYQTAFDLGVEMVGKWAKQNASVFAANDEMAAGIIDAAIDAGLSVPAQLPVVGFDDTRIAQLTRPRLTTVHVPMAIMGAAAVELLLQRIEDPKRPATKITLQSELIVRESCGASPALHQPILREIS